jgi:hypothetical protein
MKPMGSRSLQPAVVVAVAVAVAVVVVAVAVAVASGEMAASGRSE